MRSSSGIIIRSMINWDDPEHLRLHNFANSAFRRQRIVDMMPRIAAIACSLLDSLATEKQPDLVAGFAQTDRKRSRIGSRTQERKRSAHPGVQRQRQRDRKAPVCLPKEN